MSVMIPYSVNHGNIGMVFENVGKGHEVYPSIGLRHTNESIRVNFGHVPFKFAIEIATNHNVTQQAASFNVFYSHKWRDYVSPLLAMEL